MAALEKLEPREMAVLDAIITLRLNGEDDIFEYDCKEVQNILNQSGDSKKLLITLDIQRGIVMSLSKRHVLNTDQIMDCRFDNTFRFQIDPYSINVPSIRPDFSWVNQTRWAYERFQENGRVNIEDAYAKYGDKLFIKMTVNDINAINYNYMASHKVRLAFDSKNPHLCIKIDNENWKCISRLDPEQSPYKILKYAIAHPGKRITRKILSDKKVVKEGRSLKTQVFSDNEKVKAVVPFLLEIDSDSILYKKNVVFTLRELSELRTALKIDE